MYNNDAGDNVAEHHRLLQTMEDNRHHAATIITTRSCKMLPVHFLSHRATVQDLAGETSEGKAKESMEWPRRQYPPMHLRLVGGGGAKWEMKVHLPCQSQGLTGVEEKHEGSRAVPERYGQPQVPTGTNS